MMAEVGDDANHESTFEIINAHHGNNTPEFLLSSAAPGAGIPNTIPPPSALPAFASMSSSSPPAPPPPMINQGGPPTAPWAPAAPSAPPNLSTPGPPPPIPAVGSVSAGAPPAARSGGGGGNPFSIRSASTTMQPNAAAPQPPVQAPMANMMMMPPPIPPVASPEAPADPAFMAGQQPGSGVQVAFDVASHAGGVSSSHYEVGDPTAHQYQQQQQQQGGVWGWVRGAVSSSPLLSKVAETAKSSVDSVIATLDPQMKDYMNNQGMLEIVVTLDREDEIRGVRDGVTKVFPAANFRPFVVAAGLNIAAQTVGFANAIQAAQQKVAYIRNSGYVDQSNLVVGSEGFILEATPETWLYFDCLLLDDVPRQLQVTAFTQPVPVPKEVVQVLKDQTPADYLLKDFGYALSLSHAMTHMWSLGPLEWQERLAGTSRKDLLQAAAVALAYSYRSKC